MTTVAKLSRREVNDFLREHEDCYITVRGWRDDDVVSVVIYRPPHSARDRKSVV